MKTIPQIRWREMMGLEIPKMRGNCGRTSQWVIKAHVRDGVVVRVEPDDRYNQNAGREDQFLPDNDLILNNLQGRLKNILYGSASAGVGDLEQVRFAPTVYRIHQDIGSGGLRLRFAC